MTPPIVERGTASAGPKTTSTTTMPAAVRSQPRRGRSEVATPTAMPSTAAPSPATR